MAYTKILVIHNRLDKCVGYTQDPDKTSLEAAIDYALDRAKTERVCYETSINCSRDRVYQDMLDTKRRWGKEGRKRKGYHIIQSFAPGEVTPDQAHAIGVELTQRLLGDRYEAVVSTHLNKAHLHSHIVFNSVSFVDGAMYRDQMKDYYEGIRGTSDAICREHGLSVIEPGEPLKGAPVSRGEWEAQRRGRPTVRGLVRQDVEEAIRQSYTYKSFLDQLRQMGYQVKSGPRVKHTAVLPPGGKGYIRLDSLGEGYAEADIQARLAAIRSGDVPPSPVPAANPAAFRLLEPGRRYRPRGPLPHRRRKFTDFQLLYLRYLYLLNPPPARRPRKRAAFSMREELLKLDRYQEQFRYLRQNRIETAGQLSMQYDAIQSDIDALAERRKELYQRKRRGDGEAQTEIAQITTRLRALRRDLKLCARIEADIPRVQAATGARRPGNARRYAHEKTAARGSDRHPLPDPHVPAH